MTSSFFLADPDRPLSSEIANSIVACVLLDRPKSKPGPLETSHQMVEVQIQTNKPVAFLTHYDSWCRLLEDALAHHSQIIVWCLSSKEEEKEKILSTGSSYGRLCAMLALTFPDILFVPIGSLAEIVSATQLWDVAFSPLFDGTGLRDTIRKNMREDKEVDVTYLPLRTELAVAIDDEDAYAQLHAYTAYRFGFRAVPISTGSLADLILSKREEKQANLLCCKATLSIEDLYISFPDQGSKGLSILTKRHESWPLTDVKRRVFVTSDHDRSKWQENQSFLSDERTRGIDIRKLHKPHAGMFRLWESAGLLRGMRWSDGRAHGGYAPEFKWPPVKPSAQADDHGHSSPGLLTMLAEHMLERAERMIPSVQSVADAVKGAVLATDALELLGVRTPTLAIEAVRLKHHFEVLAECQFSGVEYHIPLDGRLAEIRRDVRAISQWFGNRHRKSAAMNAEMAILTDLVRVFRYFGQFDEEQQCMQRVRHLHNTLWMGQKSARQLLWPVLRYLELLLSSVAIFFAVLMLWIIGLSLLYWWAGHLNGWGYGLSDAVSSFFSVGGPIHPKVDGDVSDWGYAIVTCAAIVSGFVHLGVFISHLYSISSRR